MNILSGGTPLRLRARMRGELPGIKLLHAGNAAEFWSILKREQIDAIVLDQRIISTSAEEFLNREALRGGPLVVFITRKSMGANSLRAILKPGSQISLLHAPVQPEDVLRILTLELGLSRSRISGSSPPTAQSALEKVWHEQFELIQSRVECLEQLAASDQPTGKALRRGLEAARQLTGSLGSFGIHRANLAARTITNLLLNALADEPLDRRQLRRLTGSLRQLVETGLTPKAGLAPTLLLVSSDKALCQAMLAECRFLGWDLTLCDSLAELATAADGNHIQALLIDARVQDLLLDKGSYEDIIQDPLPSFVISDEPVPGQGRNHYWLNSKHTAYQMLMAVARAQVGPASFKPPHILHWDEDPVTRALARELLLLSDFSVQSVERTADFWTSLQDDLPDLVLLSLHLPQMNGLEVTRAIRLDENLCHLPLILLSEYSDSLSQLNAYESGVDDVILKPFNARELLSRIGNRLALSKARRSLVDLSPIPSRLYSRLDQIILRAQRQCLAINFTLIQFVQGDEDTMRTCSLALRKHLRSEDVIRRMDTTTLLVACTIHFISNFRERILTIVSTCRSHFHTSQATYPQDADNLPELLDLLRSRLNQMAEPAPE